MQKEMKRTVQQISRRKTKGIEPFNCVLQNQTLVQEVIG